MFLKTEESISFLGVPFGIEVSQIIDPENPTIDEIVSASSLIETSWEDPMLRISLLS